MALVFLTNVDIAGTRDKEKFNGQNCGVALLDHAEWGALHDVSGLGIFPLRAFSLSPGLTPVFLRL